MHSFGPHGFSWWLATGSTVLPCTVFTLRFSSIPAALGFDRISPWRR
jgi:hypothetical protein